MHKDIDLEYIHKIEKKWGEEITHLAPLRVDGHGRHYTCLDLGDESVLTVDLEGYVSVITTNGKFADVLGAIH